MFVYRKTENVLYSPLWVVGHYDQQTHKWIAESDHNTSNDAAQRCHWLNGGPSRREVEDLVDAALLKRRMR